MGMMGPESRSHSGFKQGPRGRESRSQAEKMKKQEKESKTQPEEKVDGIEDGKNDPKGDGKSDAKCEGRAGTRGGKVNRIRQEALEREREAREEREAARKQQAWSKEDMRFAREEAAVRRNVARSKRQAAKVWGCVMRDTGRGCGGVVRYMGRGCGGVVRYMGRGCGGVVRYMGRGCGGVVRYMGRGCGGVVRYMGRGCGGVVRYMGQHRRRLPVDRGGRSMALYTRCSTALHAIQHSITRHSAQHYTGAILIAPLSHASTPRSPCLPSHRFLRYAPACHVCVSRRGATAFWMIEQQQRSHGDSSKSSPQLRIGPGCVSGESEWPCTVDG
ncbi:unnamed protein product [Closterium sp. NIES-64]|nr:unnamed protein product [Closterium sp. NIES-64]